MSAVQENPLRAGREAVVESPLLHSLDSACQRLSMSRGWLYAEIAAGRVQAAKLGRRTLIADDELRRIAANAVKGGEA